MIANLKIRTFVSWTIYPFSWLILLAIYFGAANGFYKFELAPTVLGGFLIVFYVICERLVPYEAKWSMTWRSFLSDVKYLISTSAFSAIFGAAMGYFTISVSNNNNGIASNWPFLVQLLACILIYDAVGYTTHRAMHELPGTFGKFLWKVHVAHHLPPKVYVMMHAVFHPFNVLSNNLLVMTLPIWLMGYNPNVVTFFILINSLNGLISHFNVDVRLGWFNYVTVATELHRYHHSANIDESKNYGTIVPFYDLLFGTFVYRPGVPPKNLGVVPDAGYPDYGDYRKVLALPFTKD